MQLKKLQLIGFKTFADRTEIEIGDGLTAVVGPNGSGKSNVADAILWVMGEQNPRLLRSSEARDVIFSGTVRRKALGMAEVRLTIDNGDGALPLDFAEVTIARRIYRSGESQYFLNNAPCRLKDVVELFLDTGIGGGAYAFVSQREVDAVLSARAEDRRELFEEAAGIKKYRVKKREAVRKLEQAEANLVRIRDILHELGQQREPLQREAEEAERYLELRDRLQSIEVDLLISELQRSDYELYAARQERDLDQGAIRRYEADLARMEQESAATGEELAATESEADSAGISHQSALSEVERTQTQLQIIMERGSAAEQSSESLDEEIRQIAVRAADLEREIRDMERTLQKVEADEAERKAELKQARAELHDLERDLARAVRLADDRQGILLRLAGQRAQREAALAACRLRLEETDARHREVGEEHRRVCGLRASADAARAGAQRALRDRRDEAARAAARMAAIEEDRRRIQDAYSRARIALEAARRLLAERESRLATLCELQEAGDGLYQGVRAVLTAHREGRLPGFYAAAVDLMTVPEPLRTAVEVAMGGSLQDIICETEAEARAGIAWLKANRAGRATFLALPLLRPSPALRASDLRQIGGIVGVAADLVSIEPRFRPAVLLLLGRTLVADDMDSAIRAARQMDGWSRIVTLDGELLTPGGALSGGSLQSRGAHLMGRKGEIDDLKSALPKLREDAGRVAEQVESSEAELAGVEAEIAAVAQNLADSRAREAATESDAAAADRDAAGLASRIADLEAEVDRLQTARTALQQELASWEDALTAGLAVDTGADEAIAAALGEARRLDAERDRVRARTVELEVTAGRLVEKRAGIARSLESNRRSLHDIEVARRSRQTQREATAFRLAEAGTLREELERRLAESQSRLAEAEARLAAARSRAQTLRAESFEKTNSIKEIALHRGRLQQEMHEAELQIARLEVRLAQTVQRLWEDYGITQEAALAQPAPEDPEKATVNEIARLRRELRALGSVNTGAAAEYKRLTERYDFLAGQRDDLETARESLLATISEIDGSTRGIFLETFDAVSSEFDRLFQRLFGGGGARLSLTDPGDLMETGIDVIVQPPGKKPQHLSLLSGGERALTAIALLFSFLSVRPSPFCVLDEVDAPLDGPNVEKFVDLVREFSRTSQFLVITHNPTTMEAAPRWYGVTMQEPGISRILSYRVPEPDRAVVSAAPAARASNGRE